MKLLEGENINYYTSNTSPITITKIAEHSTFFKVAEIEDAYCKYIYSADVTTSSPYINVEVIEKNQAIEIQSLNKLNFCPEESLILNFFSENIDWEQRRYELAKDIIKIVIANDYGVNSDVVAKYSLNCADALIKRLKEENHG